jgi:murein L,D-transpeptidase YafK
MKRLIITCFIMIALLAIIIAGVAIMRHKPTSLSEKPESKLSDKQEAPIQIEETQSIELTKLKQPSRPSDVTIPPTPKKSLSSMIDDYFKPEKEPTPEEIEAERLSLLDLSTLMKEKKMKKGAPVFIRAFKEERELEVFLQKKDGTFEHLRTYPIAAASGELGPKLAEGDGQVPEGFYLSSQQSMKPDSAFHLAFNIGYPNAYDRAHGRTGSYIMVHGSNVSIGCLAMTDEKIEEIYGLCQAALDAGQPFFRVHIFPFRMNEKRMQKAASSEHYDFWKNLKTGYDIFENNRVPPNVGVKDKQYTFE